MREILRTTDSTDLSDRDIPPMFLEVVERGWSLTAAGGRVLTDLCPEAPGTYAARLTEETTINGRGMTDYDLPAAPDERTPLLVRRCLAYVHACLRKAQKEFGDTRVKAYVSLSFADTEEALLTSNVTFCTPFPTSVPTSRTWRLLRTRPSRRSRWRTARLGHEDLLAPFCSCPVRAQRSEQRRSHTALRDRGLST
ncbi:hypothetical protein [Streptomyces sp. bgisy029]|uniref:hypothetical protein n=1 Tax=Streptomyces sp. bgisy029 TaxID=3413771 RepID=UPI003D75BD6B